MRAVAGLWVGCGELVGASAPDDTRGRADGADDAVVDALSEISQRIGLFASEVIRGALSVVKSVRTNVSRETFALYQVIRACAARFCAALRRTACRAVRHAKDGPTVGALVILRSTFPAKGLAKLGIGTPSFLSGLRSFRYSHRMPFAPFPARRVLLIVILNKYMFARKFSVGDHADARQRHGERSHRCRAQIVAVAERARC